jgi:hypothetical protein
MCEVIPFPAAPRRQDRAPAMTAGPAEVIPLPSARPPPPPLDDDGLVDLSGFEVPFS